MDPVIPVAVQRLLRRAAAILAGYRHRARAWRELQALDEPGLRDIGLSHRAAAERWHGCLHEAFPALHPVGQEDVRRSGSTASLHAGFTQRTHHSLATVQPAPAQTA
jgi:uncharacterized protein YjiS (DUF1127 family)